MAQAFCRLGSTVSVIQRSDQILSKEDKDMADAVMQQLQQEGIRFFLNASVTDARKTQGLQEIQIQQGKLVTTLQADSVLLAQGRTPNVDNLQLSHIDLDYTKRGIRVDSRMRSSHKHIYAPGDVNGAFQFTHAAGYEASIVIANAIFHLPRKTNFKWMPWCTYTDPELASIGMNEKMASTANIPYSVISEAFSNNDRALTKGEQTGTIKLLLDAKERPLGVQIFGPRAGDLMGEWVAALNGGVKLSSLAGAIHPYPTLVEINKLVSSKPISQKIFSNKIRKILKIVFSLQGNPNNITF